MLIPEAWANARKRRFASMVKRMLLVCVVFMGQLYINMLHIATFLHNCPAYVAHLKRRLPPRP